MNFEVLILISRRQDGFPSKIMAILFIYLFLVWGWGGVGLGWVVLCCVVLVIVKKHNLVYC